MRGETPKGARGKGEGTILRANGKTIMGEWFLCGCKLLVVSRLQNAENEGDLLYNRE